MLARSSQKVLQLLELPTCSLFAQNPLAIAGIRKNLLKGSSGMLAKV